MVVTMVYKMIWVWSPALKLGVLLTHPSTLIRFLCCSVHHWISFIRLVIITQPRRGLCHVTLNIFSLEALACFFSLERQSHILAFKNLLFLFNKWLKGIYRINWLIVSAPAKLQVHKLSTQVKCLVNLEWLLKFEHSLTIWPVDKTVNFSPSSSPLNGLIFMKQAEKEIISKTCIQAQLFLYSSPICSFVVWPCSFCAPSILGCLAISLDTYCAD